MKKPLPSIPLDIIDNIHIDDNVLYIHLTSGHTLVTEFDDEHPETNYSFELTSDTGIPVLVPHIG